MVMTVGFTIPAKHLQKIEESEKRENYLDLAREQRKLWNCRRRYCVLIFNFRFVVVHLICFYMWLHVLTSRKVAIYSDGDIITIIIIIIWFLV